MDLYFVIPKYILKPSHFYVRDIMNGHFISQQPLVHHRVIIFFFLFLFQFKLGLLLQHCNFHTGCNIVLHFITPFAPAQAQHNYT